MRAAIDESRVLTPTLLGRNGILRAFPLLHGDRTALNLEDWLDECLPVERADRPLIDMTPPEKGTVGMAGPAGCLFAVFAYMAFATPEGLQVLQVRGPSCAAAAGRSLVVSELELTIDDLQARLDCSHTLLIGW